MEREEEKENKEKTIITRPIKPVNEGLKQIYVEKLNHVSISSYDDYKNKHNRIYIGKELLPTGHTVLYDKAKKLLKEQKPNERNTSFDYTDLGNKQLPVYIIKATDAGNGQAEPVALKEVLVDIKEQQFEHHSAELQEVDDEILNVLKEKEIIKKDDEPLDDLLDNFMKKEMKGFLKEIEGEADAQ